RAACLVFCSQSVKDRVLSLQKAGKKMPPEHPRPGCFPKASAKVRQLFELAKLFTNFFQKK
ncbi:MAG: hypothetical protein IKP41_06765, partial [Bacteroidaceae bacterium]|nr:hypothetical protein [Bacteroidaceae bacterium]